MKNVSKILLTASLASLAVFGIAKGASVFFPYQGGTGTSTVPSAGQVLVGQAGGIYAPQATSTLGIISSQWTTATSGIFYSDGNVGIGTSTPSNPLYVIGTSTVDGNILTRGIYNLADGVLYFDLANQTIRDASSLGSINHASRILLDSSEATSFDWSTANALIFPAYSTDGLLKTSNSNGTVALATDGTDYWSPSTLTDNNQLSNGSGYVTAGEVVTSIVAGTNIGVSNSTGTVTVSGKLIPVQWLGYYATSTTNWDDPFFFFNSTSSISKVLIGVKDGSLNGNIYYGTSQTAASSTLFKLFSSDIAITATTTPACYAVATSTACPNAINASSTPGINNVLRFTASSASTTALTATVYYSEN